MRSSTCSELNLTHVGFLPIVTNRISGKSQAEIKKLLLLKPKDRGLCRDEIEDWSASEANLFEEALEKYGKDFNDIRQDFVSGQSD